MLFLTPPAYTPMFLQNKF